MDTIFAAATGTGAISVIRVSGPDAGAAVAAMTRSQAPPARLASLRTFQSAGGETLDHGLVLWFPAPASFTGEDMAEFHGHGGRAAQAALLDALAALPGLRPAEPGEFSRRAFVNGKLDLTAAEGLADLVAAETEMQRRQALRQLGGAFAAQVEGWRSALINALARVEAAIDFADEDLPQGLDREGQRAIGGLLQDIDSHLSDARRGERLRSGIHVVILGPPNVGKSTLLNALARREAAIVSATAGTTRDLIEVHLDLAGYPVTVVDTAGLRESADDIEREGVRRALARAEDADLKLLMTAPDLPLAAAPDSDTLLLLNKTDRLAGPPPAEIAGHPALPLSLKTGAGVEAVLAALTAAVAERFGQIGSGGPTRERHRAALADCRDRLAAALDRTEPELIAAELRLAARALGRITGVVDVEDVLDRIFAEFCIGK
ncbi:MAG: tRNA uridine-5-carboxymethylaminomethyl(34) synthesis GTPase MnmE [Alphaproteobacteria bacterium]